MVKQSVCVSSGATVDFAVDVVRFQKLSIMQQDENTFLAELWSEHNRPESLFQTIREEDPSSGRAPSSRPTISSVTMC